VNFLYTQWGTPTTIDDDSKLLFEFLFFFLPTKHMPQNENKRGKKSNWTNVINRLTLYLEFPPFIFFLPSFPWEMEFFQFLVVCVDEISCRNFSIKREKDLGPFTGHSSAQIIKSKLTLTSVSKSNIRHCRRLGRIV
jgi:hypothetical protein